MFIAHANSFFLWSSPTCATPVPDPAACGNRHRSTGVVLAQSSKKHAPAIGVTHDAGRDEDMSSMGMTTIRELENGIETQDISMDMQIEIEALSLSDLSRQGGGPK